VHLSLFAFVHTGQEEGLRGAEMVGISWRTLLTGVNHLAIGSTMNDIHSMLILTTKIVHL